MLAAVAFGTAGLIVSGGFIHDIFIQLGEAIIHSQSGHLQVAKRGFFTHGSRSSEKYLIPDLEREKSRLAARPEVNGVMARISFSGLLNNGRTDFPVLAEGIEPDREAALGSLLRITSGQQLSDRKHSGLLVGEGVARTLRLKPGDVATLLVSTPDGAMNTLDAEVVGVFQSFSKDYDARVVKLSLGTAQELLNTQGANLLVVSLSETRDTDSVGRSIRDGLAARGLEVKTWEELNDFYAKTVDMYDGLFGVFRVIMLIMVVLGVANAVNMSFLERAGEFGTMRALGNRNRDVVRLVLTESLILGLLGAAVGIVAGIGLAYGLSAAGIQMPPPPGSDLGYTAHVRVVPSVVAGAFLVGFSATVLAAIPSAVRVSRMSIAEALRRSV
jgi:putative ABC transport system permease protein